MNSQFCKSAIKAAAVVLALATGAAAFAGDDDDGSDRPAKTGALPDRGGCAFVGAWTDPFTYMYGQNPGPGWGLNVLGSIDWSAKTISMNIVRMNPAANQSRQFATRANGSFTLSAGPIGSTRLTALTTLSDGSQVQFRFNLLQASNGSGVLMQMGPGVPGSADGGFIAECK